MGTGEIRHGRTNGESIERDDSNWTGEWKLLAVETQCNFFSIMTVIAILKVIIFLFIG